MSENEAIADIAAEMRERTDLDGGDMVDNFDIAIGEYGGFDALNLIHAYADRIEAAHKREVDALQAQIDELRIGIEQFRQYNAKVVKEFNGKLGNAAKLREALILVQKKINYLIGGLNVHNLLVAHRMEINGIISAALAAPTSEITA